MIRVLIVEDEEVIRNGLVYTIDWLSMNATVIASATNGLEGLEKIKELSPDIVISDIRMPKMDGLTMFRQAKKEDYCFIPIILTSFSDFDYAKQAIDLHVFDYILKPVDDEKLKSVILRAAKQAEQNEELKNLRKLASQSEKDLPHNRIILKTVSENPSVNECLKIIETEYTKHPNIEDIAEKLKVSASYLSRTFKTQTGTTFLDFLNRYRVQKAIDYLSENKYRVYEVASLCGFSDYKRFYEVFKSYTDITPTDFVKQGCCILK